MIRRLAVSDIHGEGHRLLKVLALAKYDSSTDRLFLLGDYIDRGTDSKRTVEIVQDLVKGGAVALLGNHDEWAIQASYDASIVNHWVSQGGDFTLGAYGGMPPTDVVAWLRTLHLCHEEPDCIMAHAGLLPGLPLQEQDPNDLLWIRKEFHQNYHGKRVIFGHTPVWVLHEDPRNLEVWQGSDKTGIDTGAAYGGRLSLYDLDTHQTWWV